MTRHKMSRRAQVRAQYVAAGLAIAVGIVGASLFFLGGGSTTQPTAQGAPRTIRHVAEPAGPNPSASAQMVCAPEAQREQTAALGVAGTVSVAPTWVDHVYSCRYVYPNGAIGVSVKELSSRTETSAYFASLRAQLGEQKNLKGMAQGAFSTRDGSLVVRKDYKVLFVDTSDVPVPFGSGFSSRSQVAVGVGLTVLGCWTGA